MNQSNQMLTQSGAGQVDQAMTWLLRLPQLPPEELPEISEVEATVAALTEPCRVPWLMARVAALLSPYYDKDTPQVVREMEAEDWLEALAEYPQWAVERAVRWWKSEHNADRRKRPMEGDISAKCRAEMHGIKALPDLLRRRKTAPRPLPAPGRIVPTVEERREIAKRVSEQVGYALKTFGDGE